MLFGYGLALSTMIRPEVVLSFLRFQDFGLLLVLGGAAGVALAAYQFGPSLLGKPLAADAFGVHPSALNARTLGGAAIFGIGWGICGVCPGPALAGLGAGNWPLDRVVARDAGRRLRAGAVVRRLTPLAVQSRESRRTV